MIIDTVKSNVQVIGDTKEFKIGIREEDRDYITTLLTSNLYSNPEESFIREIVSNAWDSHVEAGNTDTPVIIRMNDSEHYITIRDYGTGISPQRFKEVFCNIGSSTKRQSNAYTGGFGIGHYSSLACSNTVYITSFYEGTEYDYIMCKSGNNVTINKVLECPTEEKNGVAVTLKNIYDIYSYSRALEKIVFFPNVYVDRPAFSDLPYNDIKIKRYTNYACASTMISSRILLGNVLYPVDKDLLNQESKSFLSMISYSGVAISFNVGDLNITPNRESIIYTTETINKINNKIKAAKEELCLNISKNINLNCDSLIKYFKFIRNSVNYDPIENSAFFGSCTNKNPTVSINALDLFKGKLLYRDKDLSDSKDFLCSIFWNSFPFSKNIISEDGNTVYNTGSRLPYVVAKFNYLYYNKVLFVKDGLRFTSTIKEYLKEKYSGYIIAYTKPFQEYIELLKPVRTMSDEEKNILNDIVTEVTTSYKFIDFETDKDFLAYQEELKSCIAIRIKNNTNENIIIHVTNNPKGYYDFTNKKEFNNYEDLIKYIKGIQAGVLITTREQDMDPSICTALGYTHILVSKKVAKKLEKVTFTNTLTIDYVLYKNKIIRTLHTVYELFYDFDFGVSVNMLNTIPEKDAEEIRNLISFVNKHTRGYELKGISHSDGIEIIPYVRNLCLKIIKYKGLYNTALKEVGNDSLDLGYPEHIIAFYIMKNKMFRISNREYKIIKNSNLLKLCKRQ